MKALASNLEEWHSAAMIGLFYRILTDLGELPIRYYLHRRMQRGKEDSSRFSERLGKASLSRPMGRLLWCHAASVGEAVSLLALLSGIRARYPGWNVLVTTGTVTSAHLMQTRLPEGVLHQYVPVDRRAYVKKFLDHWQPDMAVWVESELWPNILTALRQRGIKAILINARMSEKSRKTWAWTGGWIGQLLRGFTMVLAQTETDRERFHRLGAANTSVMGNLKYTAAALPCDNDELCKVQSMVAARPVWLMASSHKGEEEIAARVHQVAVKDVPRLLTIIAPRHPVRGDEVYRMLCDMGLIVARRSQGDIIEPDTDIYLADTLGDLGLFYRLCPVMAMGGSFMPVGGHNPIEPAQLGCAILLGAHMHNFAEITGDFLSQGAVLVVDREDDLAQKVVEILSDKTLRDSLTTNALALISTKRTVLDDVMEILSPFLKVET